MSLQPNRVGHPHRKWSQHTNYTGAAGIHSEDGQITNARNNVVDHRTTAVIATEEEILKKKMKTMGANRKSLESSMLVYSQKMKAIADKREEMIKSSSLSSSLLDGSDQSNIASPDRKKVISLSIDSKTSPLSNSPNTKVTKRAMSLLSMPEPRLIPNKDPKCTGTEQRDQRGRISVDSGLGMDSDSYLSDADIASRARLSSISSGNSNQSGASSPTFAKTKERQRLRDQRRRFFRDEKIDLATVMDTENENQDNQDKEDDDEAKEDTNIMEKEEPVTISPFPDNMYDCDQESLSPRLGLTSDINFLSDDLHRTRILDPLTSTPLKPRKNKVTQRPKKKTPPVLTKPKVIYSPSLASLRLRRLNRLSKKNSKPHRHSFKYSESVENALRSLNNSPEFKKDSRFSNSSPSVSPDLPGLDLTELLNELSLRPADLDILQSDEPEEIKPHRLLRDRSFSETVGKPAPSFVSSLEQVREDDDSELRSVLRRNTLQYPAQKKSVQFFLPDIFLHTNACTSQPASLRWN